MSLARLFALREKAAKLAAESSSVSAEAEILEKEIISSLQGKNALSVGNYAAVVMEKFSVSALPGLAIETVPVEFRTKPAPLGAVNTARLRALFPTAPETVRKFAQVETWKILQVVKK
jgi:hypothetical protein